jgi:hypothetical protein
VLINCVEILHLFPFRGSFIIPVVYFCGGEVPRNDAKLVKCLHAVLLPRQEARCEADKLRAGIGALLSVQKTEKRPGGIQCLQSAFLVMKTEQGRGDPIVLKGH